MITETTTYLLDEFQFGIKVDSTNLQLYTVESLFQLFLNALLHLLKGTHPHESVDGNPHLTTTESRIK